jgi:hypothetical protein
MQTAAISLLDVDSIIRDFYVRHDQGIVTIHRTYLYSSDPLSIRAFKEELADELRTGCVTFLNKNDSLEELDLYLFYIANDFGKKKASVLPSKKQTEYLCPGCLFLGQENLVSLVDKMFHCEDCEENLKSATDPIKIAFYRTFFKHYKNGYHCEDCKRFIPHPVDYSPTISCPYFDCCYVGPWTALKRMHHPSTQSKIELLTLDSSRADGKTFKDNLVSQTIDAQTQLEMEEELDNKYGLLKDVIESQNNSVLYSSSEFMSHHKILIYQAFLDLLKKFPTEMIAYLLDGSRSGGFQHKVFQAYIQKLEESLPFSFKKNKKVHKVESLLDEQLSLFDGISTFRGIVNEHSCVKNDTQEFYIGGRKGAISKPYYIGKLLDITDKNSGQSIKDKVVEYSFNYIKVRDIVPGTTVIVKHLRVPPHYQMGGMSYINRVRKKIVERAKLLLDKDSDEQKT